MKAKLLSLQKRMLAISMIAGVSLPALASAPTDVQVTDAARRHVSSSSNSGSVIHLNPTNLRRAIIANNTSVLEELNQAYQAKANVNILHGNLLPSINVSAALSSVASGGASFASQLSILLPFLLPSNWYNLDVGEAQLTATGYGYYAVELNTYANALAAYETVNYDIAVRNVYYEEYQRYLLIQTYVQTQVNFGKDIPPNLQRAMARTQEARGNVDAYDSAIAKEKAILRQLISRNLGPQIEVDVYHPTALASESRSAQSTLNAVFPISPEEKQILSLIKASKYATLSQAWSFLGGAALNVTPGGSGGTSLSGSGNLGFGYFANIDAKNLQTDQLYIQQKAIRLQEAATIESSINSIQADISGVGIETAARDNANAAYQAFLFQYSLGKTDLTTLIDIELELTTAEIALAQLQNDLDNQRVDLQRITFAAQFASIPTCRLDTDTNTGIFSGGLSFITDLFNPKSNVITIDKLCGVSASSSAQADPSQNTLLPE